MDKSNFPPDFSTASPSQPGRPRFHAALIQARQDPSLNGPARCLLEDNFNWGRIRKLPKKG